MLIDSLSLVMQWFVILVEIKKRTLEKFKHDRQTNQQPSSSAAQPVLKFGKKINYLNVYENAALPLCAANAREHYT